MKKYYDLKEGFMIFALFLFGEFNIMLYTFRQLIMTDVYVNGNLNDCPNYLLDFQVVPYHTVEQWRQRTDRRANSRG